MTDPTLTGLLARVAEGDLDALLMLTDFLEERGDPRAERVRALYERLHDDAVFAPYSFRFLGVAREEVLPFFPEYEEHS
jgi:hypothetical protein